MNTVIAQAVATTLEARIAELWAQRQRDRRLAYWTPARHNRETELRALVRLGRSGRRLAARMQERADSLTAAKAYAELGYHQAQAAGPISEDELWGGYGLEPEAASDYLNREGDPAFNGAFTRW